MNSAPTNELKMLKRTRATASLSTDSCGGCGGWLEWVEEEGAAFMLFRWLHGWGSGRLFSCVYGKVGWVGGRRKTYPEDEVEHQRLDLELLKDGQHGDGVRGGDEGAKGQALGHGHGVGGVALGEAKEHHADKDGGHEGAHHGVEDNGGEVVEEDLAPQRVPRVENDGGQEANEEDGGADAPEPFLGLPVAGKADDEGNDEPHEDDRPCFRDVLGVELVADVVVHDQAHGQEAEEGEDEAIDHGFRGLVLLAELHHGLCLS